MSKVENIDNDSEALPGGYNESRYVLLEHLNHPIYDELPQGIQNREIE
jgi:hypothetical protein